MIISRCVICDGVYPDTHSVKTKPEVITKPVCPVCEEAISVAIQEYEEDDNKDN